MSAQRSGQARQTLCSAISSGLLGGLLLSACTSGSELTGMFRYMADAASMRLCGSDATLPVAMEADYLSLERAYLAAQPAASPGEPMLVKLEGRIRERPSAEPGRGPVPTVVVERFAGVFPGESCPPQ